MRTKSIQIENIPFAKLREIVNNLIEELDIIGFILKFSIQETKEKDVFIITFPNNLKLIDFFTICDYLFSFVVKEKGNIKGWCRYNGHNIKGLPKNTELMIAPHNISQEEEPDIWFYANDGSVWQEVYLREDDPIWTNNSELEAVFEKLPNDGSKDFKPYPKPKLIGKEEVFTVGEEIPLNVRIINYLVDKSAVLEIIIGNFLYFMRVLKKKKIKIFKRI